MNKTIITDKINDERINNCSLALGFFDGLHLGHKKVLSSALDFSKRLGTQSVVLTFKNHPVELLYGVEPEFITTSEERLKLFSEMGFDAVIMADFTKEIASLSAQDYFEKVLLKLAPKSISVGYNHKFGCKQSGDTNFLSNLSRKHEFILDICEPVKNKNEVTSSTLIRNLIKQGNVEKAHLLLDKPYSLTNTVIKGAQRGRLMDFPTANIIFPDNKVLPKFGVYAGVVIVEGKKYRAIANIGLRPTFADITVPLAEIHILDFNSDIYGKNIEFKFLYNLRDELKFNSIDALRVQISKDIAIARSKVKY